MIDPKKIKNGDMFYNGPVIYRVAINDVEKEKIELESYQVDLYSQRVEKRGPFSWYYPELPRPFRNAVPLDADGKQGYIIGIFEREEH